MPITTCRSGPGSARDGQPEGPGAYLTGKISPRNETKARGSCGGHLGGKMWILSRGAKLPLAGERDWRRRRRPGRTSRVTTVPAPATRRCRHDHESRCQCTRPPGRIRVIRHGHQDWHGRGGAGVARAAAAAAAGWGILSLGSGPLHPGRDS